MLSAFVCHEGTSPLLLTRIPPSVRFEPPCSSDPFHHRISANGPEIQYSHDCKLKPGYSIHLVSLPRFNRHSDTGGGSSLGHRWPPFRPQNGLIGSLRVRKRLLKQGNEVGVFAISAFKPRNLRMTPILPPSIRQAASVALEESNYTKRSSYESIFLPLDVGCI